jgi:hypothetical protein
MDSVSVPHATQHADLNDAVEALEAKVGADSSAVTSSHDYKIAQLEAGATGGKILQVVSTTKTDTFSASVAGGGTTSLTGLTATITPSATASKILVFATVTGSQSTEYASMMAILTRGGTPIGVGDTAGSRTPITAGMVARLTNSSDIGEATVLYLDSPSSTSALTYGIDLLNSSGSTRTIYVNRTVADADVAERPRSSSTITVMEVSA